MRSHTYTHTARRGLTAAMLGLAVAAGAGAVGCGTETDAADGSVTDVGTAGPSERPEPDPGSPRMREVAREWQGSEAERRWQNGYFPLEGTVRPPEGGLREGADQRAFDEGRITLSEPLPGGTRDGRIRWENGESRTATVISAEAAFDQVSGASGGDVPTLNVSGVELGDMRLRTSQGPADVPAWLFSIDGYDTPLRIAAVTPPQPSPQAPVDAIDDPGPPQPLEGLLSVADDGMSVTVLAGHGACDDGAEVDVLETDDSLVFAGSVINGSENVPCTAQLLTEEITVELERPVGERAMLDAFNGELLLPEA
jgi:hypothetical protein